MLSRLTRHLRWKWGRALAAMYVVCALAPGVAFAFGDGVAAHCALAGVHAAAMSGEASALDAPGDHAEHVHGSGAQAHHGHKSDHTSGHKADQMCCTLACVSALPAIFAAIPLPVPAATEEASLFIQVLAAFAPAELYKPPIA